MRIQHLMLGTAAMLLSLPMQDSQAQVSVSRIDGETLRVVDYKGKPPYRRRLIDASTDPEAFIRYSELADRRSAQEAKLEEDNGNAAASSLQQRQNGAPGKNIPRR